MAQDHLPNYLLFPSYVGMDMACKGGVMYLLPPGTPYPPTDPPVYPPLLLGVQYVYTGDANYATYAYQNDDFSFQFQPVVTASAPQPPYQASVQALVTIKANNAWNCAAAARQALMANFVDFCTQVEARFELSATPSLIPGGTRLVAQAIAQAVPAPPQETLFYYFGFQPGLAGATPTTYVDLLPGMRLRVEPESSQFVSPGSSVNGYVAGAPLLWNLVSVPGPAGSRSVAFDAFLGGIAQPTVQEAAAPPVVAGGILDLQRAQGVRRYWRLFYPTSFPAGDLPGSAALTQNVTLIGADTLADLTAATTAYSSGQCGTGTVAPLACTVFRGRAAAIPEIAVLVNFGSAAWMEWVPVGTTVANLLERVTPWRQLDPRPQTPAVSLKRLYTPDVSINGADLTAPLVPTPTEVAFYDAANFTTGVIDPRAFDLPLAQGDMLTLQF